MTSPGRRRASDVFFLSLTASPVVFSSCSSTEKHVGCAAPVAATGLQQCWWAPPPPVLHFSRVLTRRPLYANVCEEVPEGSVRRCPARLLKPRCSSRIEDPGSRGHLDLVVDVEPFGMVLELFRDKRGARHEIREGEGLMASRPCASLQPSSLASAALRALPVNLSTMVPD